MAKINKIKLPDGVTYDVIDASKSGVYTVKGTQTTTTASWTGEIDIDALYDGLTIAYYLPRTSKTNVTLTLTLNNGTTTAAIPVYVTGETRMTTHYAAGSTIMLTYWSAGSISINGTATTSARWTHSDYYISNTDTKVRQTLATGDTNRPLLMSYSDNTDTTASVDNVSYRNNSIYANPSTGTVTATKFVGDISGCTGGTVSNPIGINVDWAAVAYESVWADVADGVPWSGVEEPPTTLDGYGITDAVKTIKVGSTSYSPSSGTVSLPAYPTTLPASDTTSTYSATGTAPVNGKAVAQALATLPSPMVFKGTLGTGGTITALPVNGTATIGDTYKVITAGTYASQSAKVGDVFTCLTKTSSANTWAYIPSGDETDSDTWRNVKINGTEKLGSGISTGAVDFVNGTNTTVSFNATGNKVSINATDTNTHRPIQVNGTQILGDNTTALNLKAGDNVSVTNSSGTVTIAATDTTYSDATTSTSGLMSSTDKTKLNGVATGAEVNQNAFSNVKVGTTTVAADAKTDTLELEAGDNVTLTPDATNDKVTIAATVPVTSVAGKTGDVTLDNSDVGLGNVGNFKAVSTVASQGLTTTEKSNARTNIGAGTSSLTLGTTSSTAYRGDRGNTAYSHATDSGRLTTATASGLYKVASTAQGHIASLTAVTSSDIATLGIPNESKTAAASGTDLSLVTTGEKYEWNNADTVVDQLIPDATAATVSYPLLMSSASISNETSPYNGDIYRNNKVYCNPSSGTIHCGWIQAESPDEYKYNACQISAENFQGKVGLLTQTKVSSNNELMGVTTTDAAGTAHLMIYRPSGGTNTSYTTAGTYIGGYDYNNSWATFLVQGRSAHYWGVIPAIQDNNGRMHVGAMLDFHTSSTGTNDYNYRIRNTSEGAATYSGTWTQASSRKIKENIEDMTLAEAKKILELRPVKFDYINGSLDERGFIAEEVNEIIPSLINPEVGDESDPESWTPMSLNYIEMIPYLVKVAQEQQKEIEELKAKVG